MGVPKTHYFLLDTEISWGEVGKKIRDLKAPRLAGPVAQAGSRESSNRLRRFLGSKVGQGPLGGSESISVRSRAFLGGGKKKRINTLDPKDKLCPTLDPVLDHLLTLVCTCPEG